MSYNLFFDGFEAYSSVADMALFDYTEYYGTLQVTGGRRNSHGFQTVSHMYNGGGIRRSIPASPKVVVGVAVRGINVGGRNLYIQLMNGSTIHGLLTIVPGGNMTLSVGGVSVGSSQSVIISDTWNFIEFGMYIDNSGGTYEVRVNGSSIGWFPAATGDTQNGATSTIDNVWISSAGGWAGAPLQLFWLDDFYITYGTELKWYGDLRIDKLALSGNSTPQDWVPDQGNAWERLNSGAGYIASNVVEATSLFDAADLDYLPLQLHGVAARAKILKSDTGSRSAAILLKSDATESEGSALTLAGYALGTTLIAPTDPATGQPWAINGVNAVKVGVRVKS